MAKDFRCDGHRNCANGEDETKCDGLETTSLQTLITDKPIAEYIPTVETIVTTDDTILNEQEDQTIDSYLPEAKQNYTKCNYISNYNYNY